MLCFICIQSTYLPSPIHPPPPLSYERYDDRAAELKKLQDSLQENGDELQRFELQDAKVQAERADLTARKDRIKKKMEEEGDKVHFSTALCALFSITICTLVKTVFKLHTNQAAA